MKTIVQDRFGPADVLELGDIDVPVPGEGDVLIRVRAAGLHVGDWHLMTGLPYLIRAVGFGLRAPKVRVRGTDVAGTAESVGSKVTAFRPGDAVFGTCDGSFAEYACAPASKLVLKPAHLSFEEAAVVPTSAFAALQALRDRGEVQPGQHVLIVGASGDVGSFAVQIAKALGAEVTGVCSTSKVDWVRSLGADHVIDYTRGDFTRTGSRFDLIIETGGNRPLSALRRVLAPTGTLVFVGGEGGDRVLGGTGKWILALLVAPFVRQKLRPLSSGPNPDDLLLLKEFLEAGTLHPTIDRAFPLHEVPEAFRYLKQGHGQGKIVITV